MSVSLSEFVVFVSLSLCLSVLGAPQNQNRPALISSRDNTAITRLVTAVEALQDNYWSDDFGLWADSLWWQNANTLETLSNAAIKLQNATFTDMLLPVIARVFNVTSNMTVANCDNGVDLTLSGYFDDEDWWGLGWLKAFHLTGAHEYLERSVTIFNDLATRAWREDSCGGGVCWQAVNCYKNAITNELFLSHAAQLAFTLRSLRLDTYQTGKITVRTQDVHDWAQKTWDWFVNSGMINSQSMVNDGLDTFDKHPNICLSNNATTWSYNQGVILSGLAYLWQLSRDSSLLVQANAIANATIRTLVYKGTSILREPCEPEEVPLSSLYNGDCSGDGLAFKGIFVRHLGYLLDVARSFPDAQQVITLDMIAHYEQFITTNADSVWSSGACISPLQTAGVGQSVVIPALFGVYWKGPCSWALGGPSGTSQTSALDLLSSDVYADNSVPWFRTSKFE